MALPTNLTTNEVKDASGTEVEFTRLGFLPDGGLQFYAASAAPNRPVTLTIKHRLVGDGINRTRQSVIRVDAIDDGDDVTGTESKSFAQITLSANVGNQTNSDNWKKVLAYLGSFVFLDGTGTTHLFAGTGTGAACLINGTL